MKKAIWLVGTLLLTSMAWAGPVDSAKAHAVAVNFMKSMGDGAHAETLTDVTHLSPFSKLHLFVGADGRGFVLVAGDDHADPIVGYSVDGYLSLSNMPPQAVAWLHNYERFIEAKASSNHADAATTEKWELLLNGNALPNSEKAFVSPMLETYWDQSPYYNAFCPYDTTELKMTPCGCTATATGQIMKYYNYPASGYGSKCYTHPEYGDQCADYGNTQYLWDSMPEALSSESSAAQVNAVATLLYHIGVAVDMDYSPQGSGGKTANYGNGAAPSSENAFKYNFGYSPYIYTAFQSDYSLAEWKRLMKNELNEGRPVLYAGYDEQQEGHAFVCDGYNMQGKFHFNWGWSGNGDGFYSLDDLNPHSTLGNIGLYFNHFGTATIGIEPFDDFGTATTVNVEVTGVEGASTEGCTVSGAGHYNFGDTVILLARTTQESMRFVSWSDGCRYNPRETVATGGNLTFTALFAPLCPDTIYYSTCGNAMNRDAKADTTMGEDSIWGICLPASALRAHHNLTAVEFMGKDTATYILTVYGGTEQPEEILYRDTLTANFPYPYSWYSHTLTAPTIIDGAHSVWVVLKCTEISKPGIFSLYGGNGNGLLAGESLTPRNDLYSWMIRCFFEPDGTRIEAVDDPEQITLFPNPASGILNIDVEQASGPAQMQVTDLAGRVVMTRSIGDMANRTALDVSHLPKGLYMLRFTADGTCLTAKFSVR